ncbi:MAG: ATP-grasp domain-containing protein [Herpetosiphonaceae bacterium]|nr:ATP-grasp domain-containing protein [Herpetosiphonaceae bacterium]
MLFIEANTTGTGMLALEKTQHLGLHPIFLTNKPERYLGLERFSESVVVCDTNSSGAIQTVINQQLDLPALRGITTTSEFYIETVAELSTLYGLPGNHPTAIRACRNKARTRALLAEAGVYQPRFAVLDSLDDLPTHSAAIGLPCVVKPADDTGSNEVRLCLSLDEIKAQAQRIWRMHTNVRGQRTAATVLLEEYLDAPEYSVETFFWEGGCIHIGITEKSVAGTPFFVEHRHIFPAPLPAATMAHINETVERALRAAGITFGPMHTEVKLTPHGCAIIEINARLAGGMIPELIRHATGIDLLEQQLRSVAGQPPRLEAQPTSYAGIQFLLPPRAGTLVAVHGIERAERSPGVEQVVLNARIGSSVALAQSAYQRLGFIIARGSSAAETADHLRQAHEQLAVEVTP